MLQFQLAAGKRENECLQAQLDLQREKGSLQIKVSTLFARGMIWCLLFLWFLFLWFLFLFFWILLY